MPLLLVSRHGACLVAVACGVADATAGGTDGARRVRGVGGPGDMLRVLGAGDAAGASGTRVFGRPLHRTAALALGRFRVAGERAP